MSTKHVRFAEVEVRPGRRNIACWAMAVLWLASPAVTAQVRPAFEVASIKPAESLDRQKLLAEVRAGNTPRLGVQVSGTRAEFISMTLSELVCVAYSMQPDQIKGPTWLSSQRFTIVANMPTGAVRKDIPSFMRTLLEDRFEMAAHTETGERTALALVVARGGAKLKVASDPAPAADATAAPGAEDGKPRVSSDKNGGFTMALGARGSIGYTVDTATRQMKISASRVTMSGFAEILTTLMRATGGNLEVRDMTGLTQHYEIAIDFAMDELAGIARAKWVQEEAQQGSASEAAAPDPSGGASLLKAVQSMGLRLAARKVPIEQVVVDRMQKTPSEN